MFINTYRNMELGTFDYFFNIFEVFEIFFENGLSWGIYFVPVICSYNRLSYLSFETKVDFLGAILSLRLGGQNFCQSWTEFEVTLTDLLF